MTRDIKQAVPTLAQKLNTRGPMRLLLSILFLLSIFAYVGCSTPTKAPVSSRSQILKKQINQRLRSHQVKKGDTLYSISWRYNISYHSIARWNGLRSPYAIYPGQRLKLYPVTKGTPISRVSKKIDRKVKAIKPTQQKGVVPHKTAVAKPKLVKRVNSSTKRSNQVLKLVWKWPTKGLMVQKFAKGDAQRKGITIGGKSGASILAAEAGKVVYAGSGLIGYGKLIIIKHNKNYLSAYGYNRKILVKEGVQVKKGTRIAEMGKNSNGQPLLHFEIRRNGAPTDPLKLLPRR